ncbi:MAG: hypothetical protein WCA56_15765 [Xanthobacteraceae bacterium]
MAMRPFFSGQAFAPETISDMARALDGACETLGLTAGESPATQLLAEKIIEIAQRGVRDPNILQAMVLEELVGTPGRRNS